MLNSPNAFQGQGATAYQGEAAAARGPTALDNLRTHLDGIANDLSTANERLKRLCAKAFGAEPEAVGNEKVSPGNPPSVQALGSQVETIQGLCARLLQSVNRLETLI